MAEILFPDESYRIMGACFEVYKTVGTGFLEAVYQECLEIEFELQSIPFQRQVMLGMSYKGRSLKQTYIPDFIVFGNIVVELKATKELSGEHHAQLHNYLKITGFRLGLLVNFGHFPKIESKRIVL